MLQKEKGAFAPHNNTKYNHTYRQEQTVLRYFRYNTTTMYKCEKDTGVSRPNICRYIAELERRNLIERLSKAICPISGKSAYYFRTKTQVDGSSIS